jgi:hypothetical protein
MKKQVLIVVICLSVLFVVGCKNDPPTDIDPERTLDEISVPDNFNYETSQYVEVVITDQTTPRNVKYFVYAFNDDITYDSFLSRFNARVMVNDTLPQIDVLNQLLCSGMPNDDGFLKTYVTLPSYFNKLYIIRNEMGKFQSESVDIINSRVDFIYKNSKMFSKRNILASIFYGVNKSGELFSID